MKTLDPAAIARPSARAKLQVIVTYSALFCTHTALRLERPHGPTVFWDPGGTYGVNQGEGNAPLLANDVKKTNDLILHQAPTIPAYWNFASADSDQAMEVFEWDVSDRLAEQIYEFLLAGAGIIERQSDFRTDTGGGFCSVAVSDFLSRFPGEPFHVAVSYFFPHDLAAELYARGPNRVIVLRRDLPATETTLDSKEGHHH